MSWGLEIRAASGNLQVQMDRRYQKLMHSQVIDFIYGATPPLTNLLTINCSGYLPNSSKWRVSVNTGHLPWVGYYNDGVTPIPSYFIDEFNVGNILLRYNTYSAPGGVIIMRGQPGRLVVKFWNF